MHGCNKLVLMLIYCDYMLFSRCGNDSAVAPSQIKDLGHHIKELELRLRQGDRYLIRWDHHTVGGQLQQGDTEADHFKLTLIKGDDHSVFGTEDPKEFKYISSLLEAVSHCMHLYSAWEDGISSSYMQKPLLHAFCAGESTYLGIYSEESGYSQWPAELCCW